MPQRFEIASVGGQRWEGDDHGPSMKTSVSELTCPVPSRNRIGSRWPIVASDYPPCDVHQGLESESSGNAERGDEGWW
jgi:hypothetical protein